MATAMAASAAERAVLEEEFRWLLHAEVHAVLRQLQDILKEASLRFTLPGPSTEGPAKQENFILGSCGTDQVKGTLTLQGDALSQADVNLKMPRNNQLLHLAFREDKQWKLQQIQDARNQWWPNPLSSLWNPSVGQDESFGGPLLYCPTPYILSSGLPRRLVPGRCPHPPPFALRRETMEFCLQE